MSESQAAALQAEEIVALSGVTAGNTALCTVGTTGNDLHYRGYDILDMADDAANSRRSPTCWCTASCRTAAELAAYKSKLQALRGLPGAVCDGARAAAGGQPSDGRAAHGRVGARLLAAGKRRAPGRGRARHRRPAARLAWARCCATGITSRATAGASRCRPTMIRSARTSCTCCTGASRRPSWVRAMHTSLDPVRRARIQCLDLHGAGDRRARARTCTPASPAPSARCADRSMAAPTRWRSRSRAATRSPDAAEEDIARRVAAKEVIIGFGHPVYTIADPRNQVIKEGRAAAAARPATRAIFDVAERIETVMKDSEEDVPEPRLVLGRVAIT